MRTTYFLPSGPVPGSWQSSGPCRAPGPLGTLRVGNKGVHRRVDGTKWEINLPELWRLLDGLEIWRVSFAGTLDALYMGLDSLLITTSIAA